MTAARRLRTAEAAARLGVKPETLYAYVSRGVLSRRRDPGGSTFDAAEVERLAQTARNAGGVARAQRPLAFITELTLIEDGHLYYRGRDAVALSVTAPFETVAEWLWTGEWPADPPLWPAAAPAALDATMAAVGALPPGASTIDRLSATAVAAGSADPMRHDRSAAGAAAAGRQLLSCVAGALGRPGGVPSARPDVGAAPACLADAVAAALAAAAPGPATAEASVTAEASATADPSTAPSREAVSGAIAAALVLMADHELAASTLAVRVAASFGADPYAAVSAGMGAASGALHAGASVEVRALLRDAEMRGGAAAVGARLGRSSQLPGFGMPLYPDGDPRAVAMLHRAASLPAPPERHRAVTSVLDAVRGRSVPPPNCDFGLAALTYVLGFADDAGEALFVIGRTAGWLAHAAEEYASRTSFRVRAAYTGLRPSPTQG